MIFVSSAPTLDTRQANIHTGAGVRLSAPWRTCQQITPGNEINKLAGGAPTEVNCYYADNLCEFVASFTIDNANGFQAEVLFQRGDGAAWFHRPQMRFVVSRSTPTSNILLTPAVWQGTFWAAATTRVYAPAAVFSAAVNMYSTGLLLPWTVSANGDSPTSFAEYPNGGTYPGQMWLRVKNIGSALFCVSCKCVAKLNDPRITWTATIP